MIYYGKRFGDAKEIFWKHADIFVFPTYYPNECFPLVLLEAMQHKVACISTNEGGIPDILENNNCGLIAKKKDSASLADCLEKLLDSKESLS